MSMFLTIITGVVVFILSQIVLKLFVEPWQAQRELIGRISHHLIYFFDEYADPDITYPNRSEAYTESKKLASELAAITNRIPLYDCLSNIRLFPTLNVINKVQGCLLELSFSLDDEDPDKNKKNINEISELLKLRGL